MTRRELRENVFKMLFRVEFYNAAELPEQAELFVQETPDDGEETLTQEERETVMERCRDVYRHLPQIDEAIEATSKNWKLSRMGKVDLALLRLAVYEIRYDESIPFKVAVNEAVELAKLYGTEGSQSFVNGILAVFHDE